jgi:tetratricopeptide (TPR) repeat protein
MSKAHSIIKLLTFGTLGTAAYLQAGSDPESANRLTIMLTSLLGSLSGEVGGGILDRALFDKEAKPHASAVADVMGKAFGKALKETLQRRDDPGSEQMEAIIQRFGEKWRELVTMAEPEIAKTDGVGLLAQLRGQRLLEAWELEGLIAEIASDGGSEPYLTDDSIRGISEEVHKRLPAAFLDELTDEKSGKPFRKTLIEGIGELLNNSDEVLSGINRLDEKVRCIESKIEAAAPAVKALHQLPPPPADFTGREAEIAELLAALENASLTISGLQGMGGVGKTALALKLAEKIKERYPDGQFYLDLLGVSPQPLTPAEAMTYVIRSYHPGAELPESEAELRGIYLSVLHNQRALLLMDNARDKKQVEPLIPPAGCRLLITSRQSFTLPGIFAKNLDCLPSTDACKLLLAIAPRIGELAGEIARLCGYLPFALRLAASVIAERRNIKTADYVRQLADAQKRLELVEASLSLSYEILTEEQQRRWRMLAIFPGSFDEAAAAAVWETEGGKAKDTLGDLLSFSLVEWNETAGRYRLHDLARVFADSRMTEAESDGGRRLHARHYQLALSTANYLYRQGRNEVLRGLGLFDLERANIEAGQGWAAERADSDEAGAELCITYPDSGIDLLNLRQHPHELIRWLEAMLTAAQKLKRRDAAGRALGNLGGAYAALGETRRAIEFYEQALQIARETGDRRREGSALLHMALALDQL